MRGVLAGLGLEMPIPRALAPRRDALAHHPESPYPCTDRRHGRGAEFFAAGAYRRGQKLGLPLLLAARLDLRGARFPARRLRRRSEPMGPVAGARRQSREAANPSVLRRRPGRGDRRIRGRVARRIQRLASGPVRKRRSDTAAAWSLWRSSGHTPSVAASEPRAGARGVGAAMRHARAAWLARRGARCGNREQRGHHECFTESRALAWVGFDRAIRTADELKLASNADWRVHRDALHAEICARGFDPKLRAFSRAYGSRSLDASCLLLAMVGFLPAGDSRIVGTVGAIRTHLGAGPFVYRYDARREQDGVGGAEGAFLPCSFWLAEI